MKRSAKLAVLLTLLWAASAAAQEPVDTVPESTRERVQDIVDRSGIEAAVESIAVEAAPELEDALEKLTSTLNVLADRIANDPELRASALRTAEGMVGVAQVVVAEQSEVLLALLRAAAEGIAAEPRR